MSLFSKKQTETKVFTPQSPVNITPGLLSQLVDSNETDFTRQQLNEKYLEEKVAARFAQREQDVLRKFELKLNDSLLKDNTPQEDSAVSSKALHEKVEKLQERLAQLESRNNTNISQATQESRKQVLECLLLNTDRPLNCYDEIKAFKKTAFN